MAKRERSDAKELLIALVGDAEMLVNDAYEHLCGAKVPQYAYVHLLIDGFLFIAPQLIDNAGGVKGMLARGVKRTLSCTPHALQSAAITTFGFTAKTLIPYAQGWAKWIVRTVVGALIPSPDPYYSASHEKFANQISAVLMSLLSPTNANGSDPGRRSIYEKYGAPTIAQALADRATKKKPVRELCKGCSLRELCAHLIGDAGVEDDVVLDILSDYAKWMRKALHEKLEGEIAKFVRESFGPEKPAVVSARMRLGSRHIGVPAGRTRSALESSLVRLVDRADSILELALGEKVSEILEDVVARSLFNLRQNLADAERRL